MPTYNYKDQNGHTAVKRRAMLDSKSVYCTICQAPMWRVPQALAVNWNGLPPSVDIDRHPSITDAIKNEQRNREEYLINKEIKENG